MKPMKTVLALVAVYCLTGYETNSLPATAKQPPQEKREVAARELEPLVADAFEKHQLTLAITGPSVTFSVATQRYDDSYALFAFQVNSNDPRLFSLTPNLNIIFQPVKLLNQERTEPVGPSTQGVFGRGSAFAADEKGRLYQASGSVSMPREADALGIEIKLKDERGDQGLNYVIGVGSAVQTSSATRETSIKPEGTGR
jgi:hypothetical protein